MNRTTAKIAGYMAERKIACKQLRRITALFPSLKIFRVEFCVTLCDTNAEGNVYFSEYAKVFGKVREMFGLQCIPGFKENIGKTFFIETVDMYIRYFDSFYFGDSMTVEMGLEKLDACSFTLIARFLKGEKVCAIGSQKIAWCVPVCDNGSMSRIKPERIPENIRILLESIELN